MTPRTVSALVTVTLVTVTLVTTAVTATAAPSPSPTWPMPGAGATSADTAQTVSGKVTTVRPVQHPLIVIERDTEAVTGASFTLGADVLFATGQDSLSGSADQALQQLTDQITASGVTGRALVVGHTDDVGTPADNLKLSERRATTVTKRLNERLSGRGITLTAAGRGETQPLTPNTDDAARARNRRVSVVFAGVRPPKTDPDDVAVSGFRPAPAATGPAAKGSLAGTTQTITVGAASSRKTYQVRLDVTAVTRMDSMLLVETSTQLLSGAKNLNYRMLFTGHTTWDDRHRTALYDRSAGKELPVVIDGAGANLRSPLQYELEQGAARHSWFLFPAPSASGPLQLYVPAFGLLTVPMS